jgi:DNA-binding transcriptional LysR family regulator
MHKILPIWNWLPTFRAVAELGSFSKMLTLTPRGQELYALVRDAMRNIDAALFDEARCTIGIHGSLQHLRAACIGPVSIMSQRRGVLAVLSGEIDLFITNKPVTDARLTSTAPATVEIKMNNRPVAKVETYLVTRHGYVVAEDVTARLAPILRASRATGDT